MHLVLDERARLVRAGPTLSKLRPDRDLRDTAFFDLFEVLRPRDVSGVPDLMRAHGKKLRLRFRDTPHTPLKGVIVPLGETGGAIVNLSFGIAVVDGVRDYALTSADFAATDLTIEMLYLIEAKSAAMDSSRKLNLRLRGAMIAAEEKAYTDTLTGLKNRRALDHILPQLCAPGERFAVMQIDLDFFKAVNDTLGHAAGDHVLKYVAQALREETRESDTVARLGGDEFVIVFAGLCDQERLSRIADRVIARLSEPIPFEGEVCRISASIGISISSGDGCMDAKSMLTAADTALYASKRNGRSRHNFFHPDLQRLGAPASHPDAALESGDRAHPV